MIMISQAHTKHTETNWLKERKEKKEMNGSYLAESVLRNL